MADPKNWTVSEIKKHLEIDSSQCETLMAAFSGILRDSNLYGQKLNTKESKFLLQNCINSNLDKLPDYVRNKPAEVRYKVMKGLAQRINFNQSRHTTRRHQDQNTAVQQFRDSSVKSLRRESAEEDSSISTSQAKSAISSTTHESLRFRALSVDNNVYPSRTSLCLVENVLSENSDKVVTHQDLDFEKWTSILKEDCGYISKKHILHYKHNDRALAIENDRNFKAAVSLMYHRGDEVLNFEMSNRSNGK